MDEEVWREKAIRNEVVKELGGLGHLCDPEALNLLQFSSIVMTLGLKWLLKWQTQKLPHVEHGMITSRFGVYY